MLITKVSNIDKYKNKNKILFIHIYEDFSKLITEKIDKFFNNKFDLNKIYLKVKANNSPSIIKKLDITTYPIIKIYKNNEEIGEIYCNNSHLLKNLEKLYSNII